MATSKKKATGKAKKPAKSTSRKAAGKSASAARKPASKASAKAAKRPATKKAAKPAAKKSAKPAAKKAAKPAKTAAKKASKPAKTAKVAKSTGGRSGKGRSLPESRPAPRAGAGLDHIDAKTLKQIIAKLEEMRSESRAIVEQNMQTDLTPREESSDVGDDLDQATNERDREFNLIMHQRHLRRLRQIDEAFERMEDGSYGLCEGTDEPINPRRLLIMPLARYSLEYQEQQEKMMGRGMEASEFFEGSDDSFSAEE